MTCFNYMPTNEIKERCDNDCIECYVLHECFRAAAQTNPDSCTLDWRDWRALEISQMVADMGLKGYMMFAWSEAAAGDRMYRPITKRKCTKNTCVRTSRACINGAYDGLDGWGIDCCASSPTNCEYKL